MQKRDKFKTEREKSMQDDLELNKVLQMNSK